MWPPHSDDFFRIAKDVYTNITDVSTQNIDSVLNKNIHVLVYSNRPQVYIYNPIYFKTTEYQEKKITIQSINMHITIGK